MEIEEKQTDLIDYYVKQSEVQKGVSLANLIVEATSHTSLFAFSEILSVPNIVELANTNEVLSTATRVQGTAGFHSDADRVRHKALIRLLLKGMSESVVMGWLELRIQITNFILPGIVRGKLDQLRRSLEMQFTAGRDLRPGQLGSMIQKVISMMKWADTMSELDRKHQKQLEEKVEEVKESQSLKADIDLRGNEDMYTEPSGVMEHEEDRSQPKRRHPLS